MEFIKIYAQLLPTTKYNYSLAGIQTINIFLT